MTNLLDSQSSISNDQLFSAKKSPKGFGFWIFLIPYALFYLFFVCISEIEAIAIWKSYLTTHIIYEAHPLRFTIFPPLMLLPLLFIPPVIGKKLNNIVYKSKSGFFILLFFASLIQTVIGFFWAICMDRISNLIFPLIGPDVVISLKDIAQMFFGVFGLVLIANGLLALVIFIRSRFKSDLVA